MTAIAYALQLLNTLPQLLAAGKSVLDLIAQGKAALSAMQTEGRDPTPAEWAALNQQIKALQVKLHASKK